MKRPTFHPGYPSCSRLCIFIGYGRKEGDGWDVKIICKQRWGGPFEVASIEKPWIMKRHVRCFVPTQPWLSDRWACNGFFFVVFHLFFSLIRDDELNCEEITTRSRLFFFCLPVRPSASRLTWLDYWLFSNNNWSWWEANRTIRNNSRAPFFFSKLLSTAYVKE